MATPTPNSPANSSDSDSRQPLTVNAQVTFHTKTRGTGKGKKVKMVTTKETRAKEFVHIFVDDEANYLVFLQAILDNHHLSKYKVSDQAMFPCKVQVPPASKSDTMYIINFDEYKGLVTKISKRIPSQPIIIFIEMPEVEKVFVKIGRLSDFGNMARQQHRRGLFEKMITRDNNPQG
ncbi:hypothetical protein EI94DRAFT_1797818 [Lactarius quietus]|nr:hypothetical protein EI94DRAFT_1797818 [Lactarius quietus]